MTFLRLPPAGAESAASRRFFDLVAPGATFGVGSLPHLSAGQAARFSFDRFDVPTVPSLPRRSPAELAVAQALIGVPGVGLGQYGALAIDCAALDPEAPVATDLDGQQFIGLRAFLNEARDRGAVGPVKWQFLGPISVGLALVRAGASTEVAFPVALRAVRSHLVAVQGLIADALPGSPQLVVLDEPLAADLAEPGFPLAPDDAIDLLSGAMAVVEPTATVGVHACGDADVATLLAAGPQVLSIPVQRSLLGVVGYLDRFLRNGGWVAWGAVPTGGPIGAGQPRAWQRLANLFCEMVQAGCDGDLLVQQCFVTSECGLGSHGTGVAQHVAELLRETSLRMQNGATTARFVLGA
ncbi:MAG: hypothetical protein KDB37_03645 [Ilumatobacter sp.]|nr:hypothetical protein [Ilumatobacter sp.]